MPLVKPVGKVKMITPQIRCNAESALMQPHVFYILCKGDNAGRPGLSPWPNSFAVICNSQQHLDYFFWLSYALWKAGKFKMYHRGSAIQFINVGDTRQLLRQVANSIFPQWDRFQKILDALSKLENRKVSLLQQVTSTEQLQKCLLAQYLS